jgi:hypothetical protein
VQREDADNEEHGEEDGELEEEETEEESASGRRAAILSNDKARGGWGERGRERGCGRGREIERDLEELERRLHINTAREREGERDSELEKREGRGGFFTREADGDSESDGPQTRVSAFRAALCRRSWLQPC